MGLLKKDTVIFLLKDPHWTFIWWGLSSRGIQKIENLSGKNLNETKLTLRIHDITDIYFDGSNSHYYFDIEANGYTDHYYLDIWACNRSYCVEIGIKKEGDVFCPIVMSNPLTLPPDYPSSFYDESWSTINIQLSE